MENSCSLEKFASKNAMKYIDFDYLYLKHGAAYLLNFKVISHPGPPVFLWPNDVRNDLEGRLYASHTNKDVFVYFVGRVHGNGEGVRTGQVS